MNYQSHNKIVTDENLMETIKHGDSIYPFRYYDERMSQFDFHCIEWHWHTELEFVYIKSGTLTLWIGECKIELSEGNGIFINSRILHRFYSPDETVIPNFLCMPSFIAQENSLIYQKYVQSITSSSLAFLPFYKDIPWQMEILSTMKKIISAQNDASVCELTTSVLVQQLWLIMFQNINRECLTEQANNSSAQARLQLMMQFIHQNYSKNISLTEIADYAKISKSSALNLFNKFLHITPINYLIKYRLKEAAILLAKTEKKVKTISYETGFRNVEYFCRLFKKYYQITPTEYRNA